MNAHDILLYGHRTLIGTLEGVPENTWDTPGVCGVWSVKDILAHLASYEQMLCDVLTSISDANAPTTTLQHLLTSEKFNDEQVERRRNQSPAEIRAEYEAAHAKNMELIQQIPIEQRRQPGILSWYGADYDLEDFIVYSFYGHKREHAAQIAVYKDQLQ